VQPTNQKDILTTLHLIRAGLASGLLTKEEVVDWAGKIVSKEEQPDIFFIDLALSGSKNANDVIRYFSEYLNFDNPTVHGGPLLGLLFKQYNSKQFSLEQTLSKLFRLKYEAVFNEREESYIYSLENDYACARDEIYGTIGDVQLELEKFLEFYRDYSIEVYERWHDLDKVVEQKQEEDYQLRYRRETTRPWWKFW
jgi:hypothetical protein